MADELLGDIVIGRNSVRFSDRVGHYATSAQVAVLCRTAAKLGKFAVNDRYPTDSASASCLEMLADSRDSGLFFERAGRNEHGVPYFLIDGSLGVQYSAVTGEDYHWAIAQVCARRIVESDE